MYNRAKIYSMFSTILLVLGVAVNANSVELVGRNDLDIQQKIDSILAEHPGGKQTGPTQISWNNGAILLDLLDENPNSISMQAASTCAAGYYCAYSLTNLGGSKLSIGVCNSTQEMGSYFMVRSIVNARSTGYVQAKNSGGTILGTVTHGTSLRSVPVGATKLTCVS